MKRSSITEWLFNRLPDNGFRIFTHCRPRRRRPSLWRRLPPVAAVLAWRDRRSPLVQHILSNLMVGLGIAIVLWNLHGFPKLREFEDMGIDWVMRMQWGTQPTRPSPLFALLDIDEATYRHWGEPFHSPRDRLVELIDYAVQGGARLIVMDVDLSQRGHDPSADAKLHDYLARYAAPGRPPLVLIRRFREPLDPNGPPYRTIRRSFLEEDPRISESPLILWASPLFDLDRDQVLRRWRLWEPICTEGRPGIVPSIQLVVVALLRAGAPAVESTGHDIQHALAPLAPAACDPGSPAAAGGGHGASRTVPVAGLALHTEPDAVTQRILYTLPWRLQPGHAYPSMRPAGANEAVPVLSIRSALPIGNRAVDAAWLAGRVVVIGGSYVEGRDRYSTPLGEMPGALVLINAIHSLYQHGELDAPPLWVKLLVEAVLIVVMSLAFARFSSFWGMMVAGVSIILALLPISFVTFRYGVWLDFAIPLIAVQLHWMAAEYEETLHRPAAAPGHAPAEWEAGAVGTSETTGPAEAAQDPAGPGTGTPTTVSPARSGAVGGDHRAARQSPNPAAVGAGAAATDPHRDQEPGWSAAADGRPADPEPPGGGR